MREERAEDSVVLVASNLPRAAMQTASPAIPEKDSQMHTECYSDCAFEPMRPTGAWAMQRIVRPRAMINFSVAAAGAQSLMSP